MSHRGRKIWFGDFCCSVNNQILCFSFSVSFFYFHPAKIHLHCFISSNRAVWCNDQRWDSAGFSGLLTLTLTSVIPMVSAINLVTLGVSASEGGGSSQPLRAQTMLNVHVGEERGAENVSYGSSSHWHDIWSGASRLASLDPRPQPLIAASAQWKWRPAAAAKGPWWGRYGAQIDGVIGLFETEIIEKQILIWHVNVLV